MKHLIAKIPSQVLEMHLGLETEMHDTFDSCKVLALYRNMTVPYFRVLGKLDRKRKTYYHTPNSL